MKDILHAHKFIMLSTLPRTERFYTRAQNLSGRSKEPSFQMKGVPAKHPSKPLRLKATEKFSLMAEKHFRELKYIRPTLQANKPSRNSTTDIQGDCHKYTSSSISHEYGASPPELLAATTKQIFCSYKDDA